MALLERIGGFGEGAGEKRGAGREDGAVGLNVDVGDGVRDGKSVEGLSKVEMGNSGIGVSVLQTY